MLPRDFLLHFDAYFCALGASVLASLKICEPSFDFRLFGVDFQGLLG